MPSKISYWTYFLLIIYAHSIPRAMAEEYGHFVGDPIGKLVKADLFELTQDFEYIDGKGITWQVPAPFVTDGASVPRPFWSFIGSPLGGNYRYAAIVHDYFCRRQYPDWQLVHLNFYNGMRAKGVSKAKARIMYQAVYWFGRSCRWRPKRLPPECEAGPYFNPTKCIVNNAGAAGEGLGPLHDLNKENLEKFIETIKAEGFQKEAEELVEQPEIKSILVQ